jgi:DNA-directed RNA polymerase subunit RPC12/RpoP
MKGYYTSYECKGCGKETILITSEVTSSISVGKYISCAHCGCKKLANEKETDDLREVMAARRYKRNSRGALEQI